MARKKSLAGFQANRKSVAKTRRRRKTTSIVKSPANNPPLFQDLVEFIVPGFAGYAATRLVGRVVHNVASKKFPKLGRHIGVASNLAAFAASWLLVHRVKKLEKYHTPVTVGAAIAAIQSVVQTYLPKYGWIVSDYHKEVPETSIRALPPAEVAKLSEQLESDDVQDDLQNIDLGSLQSELGANIEEELGEEEDDYYGSLAN